MSFKISYAQNREDVIIEGFFTGIGKGFYVDIGANDPDEDSVTKLFYEKGWHGINIEPIKDKFNKLQLKRVNDKNLNIGLSDVPGMLAFREYAGHGLSTFSSEIKREHEKNLNDNVSEYVDVSLSVDTLENILDRYKVKHIHFMKIDVEGFENEVLKGNNWAKYRPELICIEANHIKNDWRPYLLAQNYTLVFHDGLNAYYIRNESMARANTFSYAEHMLTGPQLIKWTVNREFESIIKTYKNDSAILQKNIDDMQEKHLELYKTFKELEETHKRSLLSKQLFSNLIKNLTETFKTRH